MPNESITTVTTNTSHGEPTPTELTPTELTTTTDTKPDTRAAAPRAAQAQEQMAEMFKRIPTPAPTPGELEPKFAPVKIERVSIPHPYCITSGHVVWAADHHSGILDKYAIEQAEKRGKAKCGMLGCQLAYDKHVSSLTLFVEVENNRGDLNKVEGLGKWLTSIKPVLEANGIDGIAFHNKRGGQ